MKELKAYRIAVKGLSIGIHHFQFEVDERFFACFEDAPLKDASFEVALTFDKRSNFYMLIFEIEGTMHTTCDRCMADINLPLHGTYDLVVRLEEEEDVDDPDVIFLDPAEDYLDLSQVLYDFVNLTVPLHKTYDCQLEDPKPCDEKALKILEDQQAGEEMQNPFRDALKEFGNQS